MARWSEAARWGERACRVTPLLMEAHMLTIDTYDTCRYGESLRSASHHVAFCESLVERGAIEPGDPDMRHLYLRYADTLMRSGRFDEAIRLRAKQLEAVQGSWPNQTKVLDKWRSDPAMFAQLY